MWNDTRQALAWLSQAEIRNTYMHNRVRDIRERCLTAKIAYVPSEENPADVLTRDISAEDLLNCRKWWRGPLWLTDANMWPSSEQTYNLHPPVVPQHNNVVLPDVDNPLRLDLPVLYIFKDHRIQKHLRILAWILRWKNIKNGTSKYFEDTISTAEIADTKLEAIRIMQRNAFKEELKMLNKKGFVDRGKCKKLRLFLDNNGIIRCEARVQYSLIKDPNKSPTLKTYMSKITVELKFLH